VCSTVVKSSVECQMMIYTDISSVSQSKHQGTARRIVLIDGSCKQNVKLATYLRPVPF
jgi:hypothetical protein